MSKFCVLRPLNRKTAAAVAEVLIEIFTLLGPPSILQSDNGREFKNKEIVDEVLSMWPGLRMGNGKTRHSQSQGSVERANRDIENLLACWQAENNSTNWSKALNIIQFQKNKKWHSGINREPYMAMFGRKPEFGLKDLNLPDEVLDALETEEQLAQALGLEALSGTKSTELVEVENNQHVEFVTVSDDFQLQSYENIPFVIEER